MPKIKIKFVSDALIEPQHVIAETLNLENEAGETTDWEIVRRIGNQKSVAGVFHDRSGRFLLIKEWRPALDNYIWSFPAGMIEEGETPEDAMRRELLEETGYEVDGACRVFPAAINTAGMSDEATHLVMGALGSYLPEQQSLGDFEDIDQIILINGYNLLSFIASEKAKKVEISSRLLSFAAGLSFMESPNYEYIRMK
ncbi:MAG: NUDIX hydrolase [Candidatus Scalindua sp.]|jgi:ADP-ribose pyrophosphatase|nr:NUDIX hydrolase [Candidatus Scalindua sp.]